MISRDQILEWYDSPWEETWVDFKEDLSVHPDKIAATVCAMTNLEDAQHPVRYIVFGIGEKDEAKGKRSYKSIDMRDPRVTRRVEDMLGHVHQVVDPSVRIKRLDPIQVENDWTVLVLAVDLPDPEGQKVRLFNGRAYTREPKPGNVPMKSDALWEFHKNKLRKEVEKQFLKEVGRPLEQSLAELAFLASRDRDDYIKEELIRSISNNYRVFDEELLLETVEKHHLLRYNPSNGYIFVSLSAKNLYSAFYLNQLPKSELREYLSDREWEQTVLALAGISGQEKLEYIIEYFLDTSDIHMAIKSFCRRGSEVNISDTLRSHMLSAIRLIRESRRTNQYTWIVMLDLLGRHFLIDRDDTARFEVLRYLEGIKLPVQFIHNLIIRADPDVESNDQVRLRLCRVIAKSRIGPSERLTLIPFLLRLAQSQGNRRAPEVFEALLLAVYRFSLKIESLLAPSMAESIGPLVEELDSEYKIAGLRPIPAVVRAIAHLRRLARGEFHAAERELPLR
jgi:hypothetical protein